MIDPSLRRDPRIDLLRGLALAMIFINHVPETFLGTYTSRNFGFSDAAEAFVLISGLSAGLAYSRFKARGRQPRGRLQPWRRAFTIWWVQILIVSLITVILATLQHLPGVQDLAAARNVQAVIENPIGLVAPLLLLGHQFSCVDILPLYVLFMLATPGLIALGSLWPRALMVASVMLWGAAGVTGINLPTWPSGGAWFFNPLSWQVLFVAGIVTGLAVTQGRRLVPVRPWAVLLAAVFVLFSALWMVIPGLGDWGYDLLYVAQDRFGVPPFLTSFDKTFLGPPRLLHSLALAYLLSAWPALNHIAKARCAAVFTSLGRNALPVFATATVFAYLIQIIQVLYQPPALAETVLIGVGLVLLVLLASALDRRPRQKTGAKGQPAPEALAQGQPRKTVSLFRREPK